MKVIKPQKLGVLTRLYEHEGHAFMAVAVFVFFPFEQPDRLLPEVAMWQFLAQELGDTPLDDGMNKLHGEVLVHGSCYTPGSEPETTCPVRISIGSVDKALYVIGNRTWESGVPTEPEPFTEMPLSWENAFGGEGFAENPLGKGFSPEDGTALPTVELPKRLIGSLKDCPTPAGYGAYDFSWPQRLSKVGTYDDKWLKTRFPGFADDVDWTLFNVAPEDQQIEGFFEPGTGFAVENMHPAEPRQHGSLPSVLVRCFANRSTPDGEAFDEIRTRIDTVHLFPHERLGIAVYRGLKLIREDDARDVLQLVVTAEAPDVTKSVEHYQAVLEQRLKPKNPAVLLRESDLLPPDPGGSPHPNETFSDMASLLKREKCLRRNLRQGAQKRIDALRADLESRGQDASSVEDLPPEEEVPRGEALAEYVEVKRAEAAEYKKKVEVQKAEAEAKARALAEKHGLDFDQLVADAKEKLGGPPKFSADEELDKLDSARQLGVNAGVPLPHVEARLADPKFKQKLLLTEQKLEMVYRKSAHLREPAPAVDQDRALELRDEVSMKVAAGISLDCRDLTGADLSGLKLAGADLSGAFLENADLSDADLSGANLDRAVLARAKLDGARLSDASLEETNLGSASLVSVQAPGANLTRTLLAGADLARADFSGAKLERTNLEDAHFANTDFSRVQAAGLVALDANWSGLVLRGAKLERCTFIKCDLTGVDFAESEFEKVVFVGVRAERASFRNAQVPGFCLAKGCSLAGADFTGAQLVGANLRDANLTGADFSDANLEGADLSGADLTEAKLPRVQAVGARFFRADLSRAVLDQANLMNGALGHVNAAGTSFREANLFRADMARMRADPETSLEGAFIKRVRVVAPRKDDGEV